MRRSIGERSLVLLALLALLGCGGSGSSGFDPAGFEMRLIEQALDEGRCQGGDGELLICPSGALVPDALGGVPQPAPADLRIVASFERGGFHCGPLDAPACGASVLVETEGLPRDAQVRLALRVVRDGRWRVGEPLAVASADGSAAVVAPLDAGLAGDVLPTDDVQVAVLVFVPPLGDVPEEVDVLRATGARFAFVLAPTPLRDASS